MHPGKKCSYYFSDNNTDDVMGTIQNTEVVKCVQVSILGGLATRKGQETSLPGGQTQPSVQ